MGSAIIINNHTYCPGEAQYEFYSEDGYRRYLEDKKKHQESKTTIS
jgi:hypothetical protein